MDAGILFFTLLFRYLLIVASRVSCFCHWSHYLTPLFSRSPQRLHQTSHLRQALHLVLLSSSPYFRLCFNSLCGFASVNHLHFHVYYLHRRLLLETLPLKPLDGPSRLHLLETVGSTTTCRGFAFQILSSEDIDSVCEAILKLTDYFLSADVAYNLYATRGTRFEDDISSSSSSSSPSYPAVRVFLWPRRKFLGAKSSSSVDSGPCFNAAACELAGHLIVSDQASFDRMTEQDAVDVFRDVALDDEIWKNLVTFAKTI